MTLERKTPLRRTGGPARKPMRRSRKRDDKKIPEGLRDRVLARDGYRCRRCREPQGRVTLTMSHILPQGNGGPWADFNLHTLCGSGTTGCHGWVESHPEQAIEEGWRIPGRIVVKNGTVETYGIDKERYELFLKLLFDYVHEVV